MKSQMRMGTLLVLTFLFSGCANISQAASLAPTTEPLLVEDKVSLISVLEAAGATVEIGQSVSQAFFTPDGTIIRVNGADVQVFEYESPEEMGGASTKRIPTAGTAGLWSSNWKGVYPFARGSHSVQANLL